MNVLRNTTLLTALVAVLGANAAFAQVRAPSPNPSPASGGGGNESTRFGTGTITPTGGLPDLAITLLKPWGSQGMQVTVVNVGDIPSPRSQVLLKVYRLEDRQEIARKTIRLRALAKRQATTLTFRNLPLADVRVMALVDPTGIMPEKEERNNSKTRVLDSRRPPQVPDLVVDRISRNRNGLMVIVANRGNSNASPTELRVAVRRKSDREIIFKKRVWVAGIGGGQRADVQVTGPELSNLSYTDVFATADDTRKLRESNENNNTKHASFEL